MLMNALVYDTLLRHTLSQQRFDASDAALELLQSLPCGTPYRGRNPVPFRTIASSGYADVTRFAKCSRIMPIATIQELIACMALARKECFERADLIIDPVHLAHKDDLLCYLYVERAVRYRLHAEPFTMQALPRETQWIGVR
jgi:hypothetical protein